MIVGIGLLVILSGAWAQTRPPTGSGPPRLPGSQPPVYGSQAPASRPPGSQPPSFSPPRLPGSQPPPPLPAGTGRPPVSSMPGPNQGPQIPRG